LARFLQAADIMLGHHHKLGAGFFRRASAHALQALKATVLALAIGSALLAMAQTASATSAPITLGAAASYGVLIGTGETLNLNGGFQLTGNIGVGQNDTANLSGTNKITGSAYMDSGVTINQINGSTSVSGGYSTQSMSAAIAAAASASTSAAALKATSGLADQGGSITSSVVIDAVTNLSENVLDISAVNLSNGTITFNDNGNTGAKYIINVTGGFSLSNVTIKVAGGAAASDILFNIEGTGQTVSITGGTTLGTLLVPASSVTIGGNGSLTGALIAGINNAGKSYTATDSSTGYDITTLAYIPRSTSVPFRKRAARRRD
jgi:hypothetical protein